MDVLVVLSAIAIAVETLPGLAPGTRRLLISFEVFIVLVFAAEYFLRLYAATRPSRYVFSFWGVIDLLAWLPALLMFIPRFRRSACCGSSGFCGSSSCSTRPLR